MAKTNNESVLPGSIERLEVHEARKANGGYILHTAPCDYSKTELITALCPPHKFAWRNDGKAECVKCGKVKK